MNVHSQAYLILIEVIHGIEMTKEGVSNEEEVLVLTWKSALMDDEVAFVIITLVKVLLRVNLENEITHLEANWLNLWRNILARLLDVTEGLISLAVKVWKCLLPLGLDLIEYIGRNGELGAAGVDNCRVASIRASKLDRLRTISHSLAFEGPCSKPIREVLE